MKKKTARSHSGATSRATSHRFSKKTLEFIETAARQKNPAWLDRHRSEYEAVLLEPLKELAESVARELRKEAPGYRFPTQGLARIRRAPVRAAEHGWYKDWIGWMASRDSGSRYEDLPNLYFHLSAEDVFTAGGLYLAASKQVKRMREWIAADPSALDELLKDRAFKARFKEGLGEERKVKTFPRHYPKDHPRIEWLKLTGYYVWSPIPMRVFTSSELASHVAEDWRQILRLNQVLDRYLESPPREKTPPPLTPVPPVKWAEGSVQARPFADDWED